VAVFCGARPGEPTTRQVAREVGELLARSSYRLVYGGGGAGLMGEVAWAAHHHGADILGVVPRFLYERERHVAAPPQTLRVTRTMCERKDLMLAEADAFIALPGGFGTADEVFDVISLSYLRVHHKPLVLIQRDGEWVRLVELLDGIVGQGYADPLGDSLLRVVDSAAAALDVIAAALAPAGADVLHPMR
jgi:uncharacterized protein (TIGR00730 family)